MYTASSGKAVGASDIDLVARIMSMGKMHHAMTGTEAVAIAVISAIPGTIGHRLLGDIPKIPVRFGHPSRTLGVGVEATERDGA